MLYTFMLSHGTFKTLLLVAAFTLLNQHVRGQNLEVVEGKYIFQYEKDFDSSKDDAYPLLKEWMANNLKSSEGVLEIDNEDTGVLMGKATYEVKTVNQSGKTIYKRFKSNLSIKIEESRFSFSAGDFVIIGEPSAANHYKAFYTPVEDILSNSTLNHKNKKQRRFYTSLKEAIEKRLNDLLESLNGALQ